MEMNEYIVTCRSYEDLQSLYDDMETEGGSFYIPNRAVELLNRREVSRNTHYKLTCLLYTSPSPRDLSTSRMPSSA